MIELLSCYEASVNSGQLLFAWVGLEFHLDHFCQHLTDETDFVERGTNFYTRLILLLNKLTVVNREIKKK